MITAHHGPAVSAASPSVLWADPGVPATAFVGPALAAGLRGAVTAQPSKNSTSRRLLAAALAAGESTVRGVADSDDAASMIRGLRAMGAAIELTPAPPDDPAAGSTARITGFGGRPRLSTGPGGGPPKPIDVGNAGAVLRLLLGVGALLPEVTFVTTHAESLGKRPNADLLAALEGLGVETESTGPDGRLPITLRGGPGRLRGGRVEVSGARSSQFLSGLLFLAPCLPAPVEIAVTGGLVSKPAVLQTLESLELSGVAVESSDDLLTHRIAPTAYAAGDRAINGDWPGSAALLAAAAVAAGSGGVTVRGLADDRQGERMIAEVLASMGAGVSANPGFLRPMLTAVIPAVSSEMERGVPEVTITPGAPLRGVEIDGDPMTDAVLALLGAAALARGRTRVHGVSNLRIKECDRIAEPVAELRKIGVRCWEGLDPAIADPDPDAIVIEGNPAGYEGGIVVDGRGDHRVVMMLAIVALRCRRGLTITGAHHVAKSYPGFFHHLAALGAEVGLTPDAPDGVEAASNGPEVARE